MAVTDPVLVLELELLELGELELLEELLELRLELELLLELDIGAAELTAGGEKYDERNTQELIACTHKGLVMIIVKILYCYGKQEPLLK